MGQGKFEDLTGRKFGHLTVQYRASDWIQPSGQHKRMWHCLCDCGKECDVRATDIKSGNTTSCGCQSSKAKSIGLEDLTGNIYGDYIVMFRSPNKITPSGQMTRVWHCKCSKCGLERDIQASQLKKWSGECECTKSKKKIDKMQEQIKKKFEVKKQRNTKKGEKETQKTSNSRSGAIPEIKLKKDFKKINTEIFQRWKDQFPELMNEWDYEKNNLDSNNKLVKDSVVWWICPMGHSYDMRISTRMHNCGCPYCSVPAKRVLTGFNDLATKYPQCLSEWDYEKNKVLPTEILSRSGQKVWWKCKEGHSFEQQICYKTSHSDLNSTCPYCSRQKLLTGFNDLASTHPDILKEWDYEKNTLLPTKVGVGTHHKIWWKCPFGHSYQAYPSNRCGKSHSGCPICDKENHTSFPEQAVYYYIKKYFPDALNSDRLRIGMELDIYIPSLDVAIEYDGHTWHNKNQYELKKNSKCIEEGVTLIRIREEGLSLYNDCKCFIRYNLKSNDSLSLVITDVLKFLLQKNIEIDVESDSSQIYSFYVVTRKSKSLANNYPEIANEWHPTKNGNLTPEMIAPLSGKKVWWLGPCGHEYQMKVSNRTNQNCNCPYCSGKRILVGFNDFETWCKQNNREDLLEEWNYEKNIVLPLEVTKSSDKIVYWKCRECSNIWKVKIDSRTRMKSGCPKCGIELARQGKYKKVINLNTNEVFQSINQAAEKYGLLPNSIGACCNNKSKSAGHYQWMFYDEYILKSPEDIEKLIIKKNEKLFHCKKVVCVETGLIYNSITIASETTGIRKSGITMCCKGKQKIAGGYHWKYVE